jgi:hypothetical protein
VERGLCHGVVCFVGAEYGCLFGELCAEEGDDGGGGGSKLGGA